MWEIRVFLRIFALPVLIGGLFWVSTQSALAVSYGVHALHPDEIKQISQEFAEHRSADDTLYVTLPFTLEDIGRLAQWQEAFELAEQQRIIPLVRITSEFDHEKNAWKVPDRRQMIGLVKALSALEWPQDQRHVILFNEPNHAAEWGGQVNPAEFAKTTGFLADWFHTEQKNYVVLPAAADLAAANTDKTWEAFRFWRGVAEADPTYFDRFDAWNSHSYPNPGFIGSPTAKGQNSLRGFEHELEFLKKYTGKQWQVYITETGWRETPQNRRQLTSYYQVASKTVWSHPQVVAVTPFVWRGAPGPFAEFSFLDAEAKPTAQWTAYTRVLQDKARQLLTQTTQ